MNNILEQMLSKYEIKNIADEKNAIKEILQELILASLAKSGFFKKAVFCGGTALRIFYGLNRFSEDLDFSLETSEENFDINEYTSSVTESLKEYSITLEIQKKESKSKVVSAFLKANTIEQLILFNTTFNINSIRKDEKIKIKLEIDTNPPKGGIVEYKTALVPEIYQVKIYNDESLFAGKLHSILCRFWDDRVKGRDLYDFIFYVSRKTKINIVFLENAMKQTGHLKDDEHLNLEIIKTKLKQKFNELDYTLAKQDVTSFIKNDKELELWSKELFISIVDMLNY